MKNFYLLLIGILCITQAPSLQAQDKQDNFALGFHLSQNQKDFGFGVHAVSPYFLYDKVAVRLSGNLQWFEYFNGTEITWETYSNMQIGIRSRQYVVEDKIAFYGEGGLVVIFPNSKFSSESSVLGGYGLFGFEFYSTDRFSYFLELGGMGTGARADKVDGNPIYSNGFLVNVGLRVNL